MKQTVSYNKNFKYHVSLKFSAVSAIDTSGISFFKEFKSTMEKKGVEARILNPEIYLVYLLNLYSD